jgi:hypothetical protein
VLRSPEVDRRSEARIAAEDVLTIPDSLIPGVTPYTTSVDAADFSRRRQESVTVPCFSRALRACEGT